MSHDKAGLQGSCGEPVTAGPWKGQELACEEQMRE